MKILCFLESIFYPVVLITTKIVHSGIFPNFSVFEGYSEVLDTFNKRQVFQDQAKILNMVSTLHRFHLHSSQSLFTRN